MSKKLISLGNDFLKDGLYHDAIKCYQLAITRYPHLAKIARFNLSLAKKKVRSINFTGCTKIGDNKAIEFFEKTKSTISSLEKLNEPKNEIRVVFAVSEVGENASAGDLFTAIELGTSLETEFGWQIEYRPKGSGWYSLESIDILIAMVDDFDPALIEHSSPKLTKIAWVRNWFDRWCLNDCLHLYDYVFASSLRGAQFITQQTGLLTLIFRLATNPIRFYPKDPARNASQDYVFTGSYWGVNRDIIEALITLPEDVKGSIYGKNWGKVPALSRIANEFIPYDKLSNIYQDVKIVLDDANHATKKWGSVNSRVFDAIASGCLVITNSRESSKDVFNGLLPVYDTPAEMKPLLNYYLKNAEERGKLIDRLQLIVLGNHTYKQRAYELKSYLTYELFLKGVNDLIQA